MKKILITGIGSYIGQNFFNLKKTKYEISEIDVKGESWRKNDFSLYDTVIHVAAIVHKKNVDESVYFSVNRDLAIEIAKKCKNEGVQQFIFMSTMAIFGVEKGAISSDTVPHPKGAYAISKFEAETKLVELSSNNFVISIVRPPMVYGKGARGNYNRLSKLIKKLPVFPTIHSVRSMIYIENLIEFIDILIKEKLEGVFHPQNSEYVDIDNLVSNIFKVNNKKSFRIALFNPFIVLLRKKSTNVQKVFGNLYYDASTIGFPDSDFHGSKMHYAVVNFEDSIKYTES